MLILIESHILVKRYGIFVEISSTIDDTKSIKCGAEIGAGADGP